MMLVEISPTEHGLLIRKRPACKHPVERVYGILSGWNTDSYLCSGARERSATSVRWRGERPMLTRLRLENFKSWQDTGNIALRPITGFFGANSSGKSSLIHALAASQADG